MPKLRIRKGEPARVDIVRDASEVIVLESFRPWMSRMVERGERLPRDHELPRTYPEFFGLLVPLSELEEVR
jgi:hypothetical protein